MKLAKPLRFFANVGALTRAVMEGIILVVVVAMIDLYVVTPKTILNEDASTIVATVKPILQAAILIVAILAAIALIYHAATSSFGKGK
jgi:p-aminobenzoyl-glutamate transporter AbgT